MDDTRTKRATISIRTSEANKETLAEAAEANGRSLNQEIEARLEQSLLREREAGSREAAILADFTRVAASIIEAQTGKRWTEDANTYFRVSQAVRSFMAANHPPKTGDMEELDEAIAEMRQLAAAMDEHGGWRNALAGKPADPATIEAHGKAIERTQDALARYQEAAERNKAEGKQIADALTHLFGLKPAATEAPRKAASIGSRPMPRSMSVKKRSEPHSTRQRA